MAYDREVIEAVNEIMRKKRVYAEESLYARRAEVYKKAPKIKEIDELSRKRFAEVVTAAFSGKATKKSEIRNISVDLRAERAELLVNAGFPIDYLDLKFECKKCSDEGFYKGQMCSCYVKELNKLSAQRSNLSTLLGTECFKNFKLEYYNDEADQSGKSPRQRMAQVYDFCKKYAETFSAQSRNLFFTGATGLGKTFLSSCIAGEVIGKGYSVIYDSAQNIIDAFESYKFGKADAPDNIEKYSNCDLLIIDDLGTEFITQYSISVIYTLLNKRINSKLPMIVSSNINGETLGTYYPQSIVSRLSGEFVTVPFVGTDIRTAKNGRRKKG